MANLWRQLLCKDFTILNKPAGIVHLLRFYASESARFLKEQTWETWGIKNKHGLFQTFWHECRDNDPNELIGLPLKFFCRYRNLLRPEGIILKAQQRNVLVVLVLTVLPINVPKMVQEGHLQRRCQRRTSLPYEVSFPSSFILKHPGLSVSSSGLRPPVFVLSWSLKFSHHFFLLFPILTLQLSDRHASFTTDLLPVLPPPKISPFLLISLRGNEKCSVAAGGSAVVLCMDVKISEAVHVTHVGWGVRNGLIWISVGAPQWVEGKLHTCMFTWFVAADTTKIRTGCWFTQIHQHCGCFS